MIKLVHVSHVSGDVYALRPVHFPPGNATLPTNPAFPDNSLPSGPPAHVPDGTVVVLVKDPAGVWHYATLPPGSPTPTPLPELPPTEATPKAY